MTAAPAAIDTREAIAAEVREVKVGAIDSAIRELEVSIRWLQLRKRELEEAASPPFVRVFPPKEGRCVRCNGTLADHLRAGSLPYDPHAFVPPKEGKA